MPREKYEIEITAPPDKVFAYLDDMRNIGWRATWQGLAPMTVGTLELEILDGKKEEGATYRWKGTALGRPIDIIETVTKWIEYKEKVWQTIGGQKMLVMSGYVIRLFLTPTEQGTHVLLEMDYTPSKSMFGQLLGALSAKKCAKWYLKKACEDAKRALKSE